MTKLEETPNPTANSVFTGSKCIVAPQEFHYKDTFDLAGGAQLPGFTIVYETYGQLNAKGNNAILVCHALSADHHAAGRHKKTDKYPGWWDQYIGPGKPLDTDQFFVVCPNNLGGCAGSTGPTSINPQTDEVYGCDFPHVHVKDWVRSQAKLADHLGIDCWAAVVGGSLGGMQALSWTLEFPQRLKYSVVIAAAAHLTDQNIAFNKVARDAILTDADYCNGKYLQKKTAPVKGLAIARRIGHITYLSGDDMSERFGRSRSTKEEGGESYSVENYLQHQGDRFAQIFDANTYVLMTYALDSFDLCKDYGCDNLATLFKDVEASFLVVSFTTDWRFASKRSKEITWALIEAGKQVTYLEIGANKGHDAFLLPNKRYQQGFTLYMQHVANVLGLS